MVYFTSSEVLSVSSVLFFYDFNTPEIASLLYVSICLSLSLTLSATSS